MTFHKFLLYGSFQHDSYWLVCQQYHWYHFIAAKKRKQPSLMKSTTVFFEFLWERRKHAFIQISISASIMFFEFSTDLTWKPSECFPLCPYILHSPYQVTNMGFAESTDKAMTWLLPVAHLTNKTTSSLLPILSPPQPESWEISCQWLGQ